MTTSTDSSTEPANTAALTESDRNRLFASEGRRALLDVLDGGEEWPTPVDVATLATAVAEETAGEVEPAPEAVERIAISLHHNHLPRLSDAGVLDYDEASNRVTRVGSIPVR